MSTEKTEQSTKVITGMVRLSYFYAFKPRAVKEGEEAKYSVQLIIQKTDKQTTSDFVKAIKAARAAGQDKLKDKNTGKESLNLKMPLRDGDKERPNDPALKGCFFINATSKNPPQIIDRHKHLITDSTLLKSGDYARVAVNFYAFDGRSKGIACGLNNIQKLKDGPALGGRAEAIDDFKDDFQFDEDEDLLAGEDELDSLLNG